MEFDATWLLIGLPIAFAFGWLSSRLDLRQLRIDNRRSPKAYFKGLNHLLNEQQDEAIDAFIEAVQKDPDTSELHFALGNLFRRRGEFDRAVRVHQHLLARGDLPEAERQRAQHALALDYLQAGLLDRAEQALTQLEHGPFQTQARLARLAIYERTRDWAQAQNIALELQNAGQGDFSSRIAHYLCEQAQSAATDLAHTLLLRARALAPQAGRARIMLIELHERMGDLGAAMQEAMDLMVHAPSATALIADKLATLALQTDQATQAQSALQKIYDATHSVDVLRALARLKKTNEEHLSEPTQWLAHLQSEPSLIIASQWLKAQHLDPQIQRALDHAIQPLLRYRCASCGFEASRHFWQCPGCQSWDSYSSRRVEEL